MALLNRPLTEDEARKMLQEWRDNPNGAQRSAFWNWFGCMTNDEPIPHVVHYRAGRYWYHRPENFPLLPRQRSPSDCTWIVPGT